MKKKLRSLAECLNTGTTMQALLSRSRKQQQLLQQVRSMLPEPLCEHCVGAVKSASRLLIYVDSSAWAGRLRFISRELTTKLNESGLRVERITVRVMLSPKPRRQTENRRLRQLSADNASLIIETAEAIDDPELQAAMKRLARHRK
ncbi:MAG: DciA family protein [Candidatus Sedimenticola sp. (ex Thyasira tokunagai)]